METIPYGKQQITEDDIQAVINVLKSDFLTQGPKIDEFEKLFARYVGAKYAVAVANGTAALHLNALALGIKPGDRIITTPLTFAATANCIRYCGGEVVFADIDPKTYLLDINAVKNLLKSRPKGAFKGIIPVDFAGRAINMETYRNLADEYGLWLIEDACHAPGGYFKDSKGEMQVCGNGNFADLSIFSFHPVKHIAIGEGGMITTNNALLYEKLLNLRTHGITRESNKFHNSIELAVGDKRNKSAILNDYPRWYMEMQDLGYNYRLTDFQAALGISQLQRAEIGLTKRKMIAEKYTNAFANANYIYGFSGYVEGHAYHLYIIEVHDRLGLYNYLRENNIFCQIHYIPLHFMPYYQKLGWKKGDFTFAENYYDGCISLPIYPSLSLDEQDYVIQSIENYYNG